MKKLTTLFTTTMIALALMMAVPSAMAGEKAGEEGDNNYASAYCKANYDWFMTHGACVKIYNMMHNKQKNKPAE